MQKKICPICESDKYSKLVYDKKLPDDLVNPNFAGRKDPDGYHYQIALYFMLQKYMTKIIPINCIATVHLITHQNLKV